MKQLQGVLIGAALVLLAGAWVYLSRQDPGAPAPDAAAPPAQEGAASTESQPGLRQNFEDLLNSFLQRIADKVQDYKKERRVLAELVRPENLRSDEYVDQNYDIMQKTVPALHLKIDDLMLVFEDTEGKIHALLKDQPQDVQDTILSEWKAMKEQQANLYIGFFNIEEEVLQAYEDMMTYYHDKKGAFTYDETTGQIVFQEPSDEEPITELREKLRGYVQAEAQLLKEEQ